MNDHRQWAAEFRVYVNVAVLHVAIHWRSSLVAGRERWQCHAQNSSQDKKKNQIELAGSNLIADKSSDVTLYQHDQNTTTSTNSSNCLTTP